MKKAIIFLLLIYSFRAYSQIGHLYSFYSDNYRTFKYTVSYKQTQGMFVTTYKIIKPSVIVIATHNKVAKHVSVRVKSTNNGIFDLDDTQEIDYSTPNTIHQFGIIGNYNLLGGKRVPNQCALKFLNSDFNYVSVFSVIGEASSSYVEFFVFK